ncbi:Endophilin-A2 [Cladochytrium tenue]|nr:Endophilin-A2 [Cladochytrium tenue]
MPATTPGGVPLQLQQLPQQWDVAFRNHLVDNTIQQVTALRRYGWIDQKALDAILALLPSVDLAPDSDLPSDALPSSPITYAPSHAGPTAMSFSDHKGRATVGPLAFAAAGAATAQAMPTVHIAKPASPVPPSAPPVCRVAIRDFISDVDGDLNFRVGDVIEVLEEVDENWLAGMLHGKMGIFPKNMTEAKSSIHTTTSSPKISRRTTKSTSPGPTPTPPPLNPKPKFPKALVGTTASTQPPHSTGVGVAASTYFTATSATGSGSSAMPTGYFYIRSRANGNVLGVQAGIMVTHDTPALVVPLTAIMPPASPTTATVIQLLAVGTPAPVLSALPAAGGGGVSGALPLAAAPSATSDAGALTTIPLALRLTEGGCLVTASNLALDIRHGETRNGGTVVLNKRVVVDAAGAQQGWRVTEAGTVENLRAPWLMLVEDRGRALVWDRTAELDDQRWELVAVLGAGGSA